MLALACQAQLAALAAGDAAEAEAQRRRADVARAELRRQGVDPLTGEAIRGGPPEGGAA